MPTGIMRSQVWAPRRTSVVPRSLKREVRAHEAPIDRRLPMRRAPQLSRIRWLFA